MYTEKPMTMVLMSLLTFLQETRQTPSCWLYQNMVGSILLSTVVAADSAEKK